MDKWDVFISYASEDGDWVEELARGLELQGVRVWIDKTALTIGDNLRRSIDDGLANSRYGAVVLSKAFLRKSFPQHELDGLFIKEMNSGKTILPIWHGVTAEEVRKYSLPLANKIAASSTDGVDEVVKQIVNVVKVGKGRSASPVLSSSITAEPTPEPTASASDVEVTDVYDMLYKYFDKNEMDDLAFRLGIESEDLDQTTKDKMARSFARYMARHHRLQELRDAIFNVRPNLSP